jgi:hypothetical protein
MDLSSDIQAHQKLVMAKMAASAELQAKVDAATAEEPAVIPMESFTDMLQNKSV